MASSIPLKNFLSASTFPSSLRIPHPTTFTVASSTSRLFNTRALRTRTFTVAPPASRLFNTKLPRDDEEDEDSSDDELFSSLTERTVLFAAGDEMQDRISSRQVKVSDLIARETEDVLQLRMGKDDVKVWMEQGTLVISGAESEDGGYSSKIHLAEKAYRTDEVKAEMKNGVLKVTVPKVKEEDRKDVIHVSVE